MKMMEQMKKMKAIEGKYGSLNRKLKENQDLQKSTAKVETLSGLQSQIAQLQALRNNPTRQTIDMKELSKMSGAYQTALRSLNQLKNQQAALKVQINSGENAISKYRNELSGLKALKQTYSQGKTKGELKNDVQYQAIISQMKAAQSALKSAQESLKGVKSDYRNNAESIKSAQSEVTNRHNEFKSGYSEWKSNAAKIASEQAALKNLQSTLQAAGVNTNNLASAQSHLAAQLNQATAAMQNQSKYQSAKSNAIDKYQAVQSRIGEFDTAKSFAASITNPFMQSIEKSMDLESTISELKALTQFDNLKVGNFEQSRREMTALENQIKHLGATTNYTQQQVAEAQVIIARTGFSPKAIEGSTESFLKLAAVGKTDLVQTADIATNIMTGFGLIKDGMNADEIAAQSRRVSDVMAYATAHSNQNIQQLGETLKYVAPIAKNFGSSFEETTAMTKFLADAGIQGSMAGTSLRQTMLRLTTPPKRASQAMQEMGITVDDAQKAWLNANAIAKEYGVNLQENISPGRQMLSIMKQIDSSMAGKTSQEKMSAFSAITGINAVSGAINLFDAGSDKLDEFTKALEQSGGASDKMYRIMNDNAKGQIQILNSAVESVQTNIGDVFLKAISGGASNLAPMISSFAEWINQHKTLVQWIGILIFALAGLVVAIAAIGIGISIFGFLGSTLSALAAGFTLIRGAIMGFIGVQYLAAAASGILSGAMMVLNAIMSLNPVGLIIAGILLLIGIIYLAVTHIDGLKEALINAWNDPQGAVHGFCELIKSAIGNAIDYIMDRWNTLKSALSNPFEAAMNFVGTGSVVGGNVTAEAREFMGSGGSFANDNSAVTAANQALADSSNQAAVAVENHAALIENFDPNALSEMINQSFNQTGESLDMINQTTQLASPNLQLMSDAALQSQPNINLMSESAAASQANIAGLSEAAASASSGLTSISSAAFDCASALQSAAAQISSIHISIPTITTAPVQVASNAQGGIYSRGAFLTTFAENSPEAAIPINGSTRAVSLWQQVGEMLGVYPNETALMLPPALNDSSQSFSFNYNAPNVNYNGGNPESLKQILIDAQDDFEERVRRVIADLSTYERRISYQS